MANKPLPPGVPEARTPVAGGTEDRTPPPKHGTERPVAAGGDLPRLIDPLDRAPNKGKAPFRFKIRCNNYTPQKMRYVLANTEEEATALYLKLNGLDRELERLKKIGLTPDVPDLVVTRLED